MSRRVAEKDERARLERAARRIGGGLVVRSAAAGGDEGQLDAEAAGLDARWAEILSRARAADAPAELDPGDGPVAGALRELGPAGRVVVEGAEALSAARAFAARLAPGWEPEAHRGPAPLFETEGVEAQIEAALARRVPLPGGGALVFDRTEAATVVDVDTGGAGRGGRAQATLDANLEAAAELGRQLRLRAVAGLVVVDFVRMRGEAQRARVRYAVAAAVAGDWAQLRVGGFTPLGLFELTRSRERAPLAELMLAPAPEPAPSPEAQAAAALRAAERAARTDPAAPLAIETSEAVAAVLEGPAAPALAALAERLGGRLSLRRAGPAAEGFAIVPDRR